MELLDRDPSRLELSMPHYCCNNVLRISQKRMVIRAVAVNVQTHVYLYLYIYRDSASTRPLGPHAQEGARSRSPQLIGLCIVIDIIDA